MMITTIRRLIAIFDTAQLDLMPPIGAGRYALPEAGLDEMDPLAQMALADAADASLMRLVLCAASATLALALLTSLL
jgi:hypothetical protein